MQCRSDRQGAGILAAAPPARFAPFTSWLTLAFLLGVLVLMGFDYPDGTYTVAAIPLVAFTRRVEQDTQNDPL